MYNLVTTGRLFKVYITGTRTQELWVINMFKTVRLLDSVCVFYDLQLFDINM